MFHNYGGLAQQVVHVSADPVSSGMIHGLIC